ncbi:MAG: hypothetical protein ACRDJB_01505 [Actinomycetota bacterium]
MTKGLGLRGGRLLADARRAGVLPGRFRDALDRPRLDDEFDLPLGLRALPRVLVATGSSLLDAAGE